MLESPVRRVYLDYSATTPVDKRVVEAMLPFFSTKFGNASSIHRFGREAKDAVERARERIAQLLRASPEEIFFTSGGTESDNWALTGYCLNNRERGSHVVTCNAEHHAVLNTCAFLEQMGFEVTRIPLETDGTLDPDRIAGAVTGTTLIVSVMHANNEIGTINDIKKIGTLVRERGAVFHSDAVQTFGKVPIDVNAVPVDMLSISGHKIYGPKGIGALYIRRGTNIGRFMHGGDHERRLRSGTENVPGIVGFGTAVKICGREMEKESAVQRELRNYFWEQIRQNVPDVRLNGPPEPRLPGNLNVSFREADGESVLLSLDLHGIAASAGSACESGSIEPSHVIKALDLAPEFSQSAVRFSLGRWTSRSDIDYTISHLKDIVERVRRLEKDFA